MATNYGGLDIGSALQNYGQLMAQGYKDKIQLEQQLRARGLQEAAQQEQMGRQAQEASALYGYDSPLVQKVPYIAGAIAGRFGQPSIPDAPQAPQQEIVPMTPQARPGPFAPGMAPSAQPSPQGAAQASVGAQAAPSGAGAPSIQQLAQLFPDEVDLSTGKVSPRINKAVEDYQNKQLQLQNSLALLGVRGQQGQTLEQMKAQAEAERVAAQQAGANSRNAATNATRKSLAHKMGGSNDLNALKTNLGSLEKELQGVQSYVLKIDSNPGAKIMMGSDPAALQQYQNAIKRQQELLPQIQDTRKRIDSLTKGADRKPQNAGLKLYSPSKGKTYIVDPNDRTKVLGVEDGDTR